MDSVAVDDDWGLLLSRHIAKALNEDKDARCLLVLETRIVGEDHEVPND